MQGKTVTVRIETGNAAFDDASAAEVARILRELATRIERYKIDDEKLRDINGNVVGYFKAE